MSYKAVCSAIWIVAGVSVAAMSGSCKKGGGATPRKTDTTSVAGRDEDSLKYLMYQIMQKSFVDGGRAASYDLPTYYWYQQVPSLDPESPAYGTADNLLAAMAAYPKVDGKKVDRYSFLDRTGSISGEIEHGIVDGLSSGLGSKGSFGLQASYSEDGQNKSHLMVLYADPNSPAGKQGIGRGWEITAVNGNSNVSYDGADGANVTRVQKALYSSDQVSLTLLKPDGKTGTYSLDAASYQVDPVLFDSVYTVAGRKVGYFVFYTFSSVEDDKGATPTKSAIDAVFTKFKAAGISDLIVDLRYNGGGAVSTAQYLDSAIAPASATGRVMYRYLYNDKLTSNEGLLGLSPVVYFPPTGGLDLDHVFFIVSRNTASASELTLNNLKPYMDVKLVGDTTYGKPVGFIDFTISDYDASGKQQYLADLYAIDFATENAAGTGGYYEGIPPDHEAVDYINLPWGDVRDDNLVKIFNYISTGSFSRAASRLAAPRGYRRTALPGMEVHHFNGMIDFGLSRKLSGR
jgi:hypothetical protein